jgi:hypothetical protein
MVRKITTPDVEATPGEAVEAATEAFAGDISALDFVYTNPKGEPLPLVARLAKIMGSLPVIEPEGENTFFKYKFVKDKQVLGIVRPRLSQQRIIIIPETVEEADPIEMKTAKGGTSLMTRIKVTWRILDGVTGETLTGQSLGYGDDSGDKGANKAYTAALKNFLIKLFEIGGEPDIEEDEGTDKRAKARESSAPTVEKAVIGDAEVGDVERGGKASAATDAQIARVGQYIRDLHMDPESFAALVKKETDTTLTLGDEPWVDIKSYLEHLSGRRIGGLIAILDKLYKATVDVEEV